MRKENFLSLLQFNVLTEVNEIHQSYSLNVFVELYNFYENKLN